jgi:hypothetical protein
MSQFACVDQPAFLEILNTAALPWQKAMPCGMQAPVGA